jgi:hypothetical protein
MIRRIVTIAAVGMCSLGVTASSPYINGWTQVWVDCLWDFWDYEGEAETNPSATGPIYEVEVETEYFIGCGGLCCGGGGEGILSDVKFGNSTARVNTANNGSGWHGLSFGGYANSDHWLETESFGDYTTSGSQNTVWECNQS